ncbi:putative 5'-3' exoribonuclease [Cafeteria roenbergensis virus]|uniref:Putative 5'-3' exoribonuclease n=1 Tax=Cafeteria roenbergensis virus (strain BV-PW1) TaxID=693272 RepID=E3T4Q9_CROVB|nr:putative 5'-3' exoribonuclease [Cafeteria roenbergensis virus BV-PW1]ADO67172.1 putative 5'-3' exoribonuclease [Cafeteria roenbergensis virus BV-PW1]
MGLEKIYNTFYRLFGGNEDMEENDFDDNFNYIPAESIFIDGNFIVYHIFNLIEQDINDILKVILAVPHNSERDKLIKLIHKILENSPLKNYAGYFEDIFYQESLEKMVEMLRNKTLNLEHKDNQMKHIISEYYLEYVKNKIINLHYTEFIKNIYLIFDGVPSGFKIIEQRRRRFKNYLESNIRKSLLENHMINFPDNLTINQVRDDSIIFDYGKFVENMITLNKSFGPSSNLFKIIGLKIKYFLNTFYPKITYWYSGVNEKGEADFKILHLCRLCEDDNIVVHCSDFDFIILCSRLQNNSFNKLYMMRHFDKSYLIINFSKLNKRIMDYLLNIFKIKLDKKIIDDFYFIINLFGNDYIPPLKELNFDTNFMELIEIIGNNLWKNNKFILKNEKIDFNNLKQIFIKLNNFNNLNLKSYLKNNYYCNSILKHIPPNITTFYQFDEEILTPYWLDKIFELESWDDLYQKDIRLDIIQLHFPLLKEDLIKKKLDDLKNDLKQIISKINILPDNLKITLDKILKPYYTENKGLKKKVINYKFNENIYDNLYYFYCTEAKNKINELFPLLENRNEINNPLNSTEKEIVNDYLLTLELINYKFYNPMSYTLFFYKNYNSPPISLILNCIDNYVNNSIESYLTDETIDTYLHLILISPNNRELYSNYDTFFKENTDLILVSNSEKILNNSFLIKKFNLYRNINLDKIRISWDDFILNLNKNKILANTNFDIKLLN